MTLTQETVKREGKGPAAVISPEGEVDMHESPKLRAALAAETAKKPSLIIVDLGRVTFIDSSGVATLVEGLKRAKPAVLALCGMNAAVKDVFELSRLDKVFTIYPSRQEALSA